MTSKLWIVCQQNEGQKPSKVMAFADKDRAAKDCAERLTKAPANSVMWLETVDFDGGVLADG